MRTASVPLQTTYFAFPAFGQYLVPHLSVLNSSILVRTAYRTPSVLWLKHIGSHSTPLSPEARSPLLGEKKKKIFASVAAHRSYTTRYLVYFSFLSIVYCLRRTNNF